MAYTPRDMSGSVFRNDRKREGKKDADFAGSAMIDGQEYWVDMWTKPPQGDKKGFFSISFRPKEGRPQQQQTTSPARSAAPPKRTPSPPADPDLDAPFGEDATF